MEITAASVFPEPVGATSSALRPLTSNLKDLLWIGVSSAQPISRYLSSTRESSVLTEPSDVCVEIYRRFVQRKEVGNILNSLDDLNPDFRMD